MMQIYEYFLNNLVSYVFLCRITFQLKMDLRTPQNPLIPQQKWHNNKYI